MQEKKSTLMSVGVFVSVSFLVAMVSVLFVGKKQSLFERMVPLKAHFTDIVGLRHGATVQLSGLNIGFVESVDFSNDVSNPGVEVLLKVNKKFKDRIRTDSVASIQTQGLLGDKLIYISPGSDASPPLSEGGMLQTEVKPGLTTLVQEANKGFQELGAASHSLKLAFDELASEPENKKRFGQILDNMDAASADLKSILDSLHRGEGTIGALLKDPALYNDLRSLMGRADRNKLLKKIIRATIEEQEKGGAPVNGE